MKKILLLMIITSLITLQAQAQFRFGAKAGVNTNFISADVLEYAFDNSTIGFLVGPTVEYLVDGRWGLDAAVLYTQKGIQVKGESAHRIGYIELPVNFKYTFPLAESMKLFATAGPYVDFKVAGDKTFDVNVDGAEGQWETRTFGGGLNLGAGVELFRMLQMSFTYGFGLSDNFQDTAGLYSARERVLSFAAAVYF